MSIEVVDADAGTQAADGIITPVVPGEVVHHYTDASTALTILQNRTLWLAAPWHLNDPREGTDFLDFLVSHGTTKSIPLKVVKDASDLLTRHLFYVACFSEDGDSLPQWRAYAKDAQGASIGFNRSVLRNCLAGQSLLIERPIEYADAVENLDTSGEAYKALEILVNRHSEPSSGYLQTLSKVRYAVKRRAYREECEVRLIFTPSTHPLSGTKLPSAKAEYERRYFGTPSEIRDVYALTFSEEIWPSLVNCITFGPRNRTNLSVARDMLNKFGLRSTDVRYSGAHYK